MIEDTHIFINTREKFWGGFVLLVNRHFWERGLEGVRKRELWVWLFLSFKQRACLTTRMEKSWAHVCGCASAHVCLALMTPIQLSLSGRFLHTRRADQKVYPVNTHSLFTPLSAFLHLILSKSIGWRCIGMGGLQSMLVDHETSWLILPLSKEAGSCSPLKT